MQFYMICEDPEKSAQLLPDSVIKNVNLREGWQILSDIGHKFGVTWEGQEPETNVTHPVTMQHYVNREAFVLFMQHYFKNLQEYTSRFNKTTVWHERFYNVPGYWLKGKIPPGRDKYEAAAQYMLDHKSQHLSDMDKKVLQNQIRRSL